MTILLNGVELSRDLRWANEFDNVDLEQTYQRTVGGRLIVSNFPKEDGAEIQLESVLSGDSLTGYFTRAQVKQFKVLEAAATPVDFNYHGQSFTVIVQAGGVQVSPILSRPDQEDTDLYTGTIILVTV